MSDQGTMYMHQEMQYHDEVESRKETKKGFDDQIGNNNFKVGP